MKDYFEAFLNSFKGTLDWTIKSIVFEVPWYHNYFWGLILISLIVWCLEIVFPWRKHQKVFRKDFWLDAFYMFFNFFLFSIFISGFYRVFELFFEEFNITIQSLSIINLSNLPEVLQLLIFFILLDFFQWFTHVLLHRYEFLWQFHKVHHSVKEMGFAAHLRYHWMENVLYKPLKVLGVMLIGGFEPNQAFIVHFLAITIGHLNHANIKITWGVFKYIFNNPVMHLHHHAKVLPKGKNGVNYGISLSVWDYIFKTNYIPNDNPDTELGFQHDEDFPSDFMSQNLYGFSKKSAPK